MLLTVTPTNPTLYRYVREVNATYGSETVACLERVYQRARELCPDLPAHVSFTIKQSDNRAWGHFMDSGFKNTYQVNGDRVHEIMISGECLAAGALKILQTVVHEAAHALCAERGIKDTTRQGRYHNKKFVHAAEELTLTYDDPQNYVNTYDRDGNEVKKLRPDDTHGFSNVCLTDRTMELFKAEYDMLVSDLPLNKGISRRWGSQPKVVKKVYTVFRPTGETPLGVDPAYRLQVFGPKKYEAQCEFLISHTRVWSALPMGVFAALLEDAGITTDKEITREDWQQVNSIRDGFILPDEIDNLVRQINGKQFKLYERDSIEGNSDS